MLRSIKGDGGELHTLDSISEAATHPLLALSVKLWFWEYPLDPKTGQGVLTLEARPATAGSMTWTSGTSSSTSKLLQLGVDSESVEASIDKKEQTPTNKMVASEIWAQLSTKTDTQKILINWKTKLENPTIRNPPW